MTGSSTGERGARLGLAVGIPVLTLAAASLPFLAVRSDLPDRVASHFSPSGRPDGSMSVAAFLVATGALVAVGITLCVVTAVRRPTAGGLAASGGFLGGFLAGLGAGLLAATSITQRGIDDWRDASGAGWTLLGALGLAVALGAIGARVAANLGPDPSGSHGTAVPMLDLATEEEAVWVAVSRSTPLLLTGLSGVVLGAALAVASNRWTGLVVLVAGLLVVTLSTFRVRADRRGLRIRYGLLAWPSTVIDIERLAQASVIDVRPLDWGGWGYRGSLRLMRRAAVVHRAGPGIRCDLVDGRVLVVTVDEPALGVAVLNAQVRRTASSIG